MAYQLLALQLDPNRRDEGEMEDGRGRGREGRRKQPRAEKVRQGKNEEARQSGRKGRKERQGGERKRGSAPRTKLKSRGCNSSDLKTILYNIGKAVFDEAGGKQHITEAAPNELKLGEGE